MRNKRAAYPIASSLFVQATVLAKTGHPRSAQFLQSKSQSKPSAASATAIVYSQKKASMKTILLLHDEARRSVQLLQNAVPAKAPLREVEAVAGCDCDRWGHPCRARCSTDT
jgi:hypothetical protein